MKQKGVNMNETTWEEYKLIKTLLNSLNNQQLQITNMALSEILRDRERDEN
tara:strand:+ start:465 stop:617 length:153 start_codon:yes stop_codon:yes gene_type:complete